MRYIVKDMSCQHCVRRITDAVKRVAGVTDVSINLDMKSVEVYGTADSGAVMDAMKGAGYTAERQS